MRIKFCNEHLILGFGNFLKKAEHDRIRITFRSPRVVGRADAALEDGGRVIVLRVDGDDAVAVDVEEGRGVPERGQVQHRRRPARKE